MISRRVATILLSTAAWIAAVASKAAAQSQPPAAVPAVARPPVDATLDGELKDIDQRAAAITDLTATFEQSKRSILLKEPMVSRGSVKVKGARVLWTTTSPRPTTMLIDQDQLKIHYPQQRVLEVYELDDTLRRVVSSPLPRLDAVKEQFEIVRSNTPPADPSREISIDLTPKSEDLRSRVSAIRVTIDRSTGLASRMEMSDADGERTIITFSEVRTGTGLQDRDFVLEPAEGTRVPRPLEGLRAPAPAPAEPPK